MNEGACLHGGTCVAPNLCECSATGGYFGDHCELFQCIGTVRRECSVGKRKRERCKRKRGGQGGGGEKDEKRGEEGEGLLICVYIFLFLFWFLIGTHECLHNGTCVAPNTCDCSTSLPAPGYFGPVCEQFSCSQVPPCLPFTFSPLSLPPILLLVSTGLFRFVYFRVVSFRFVSSRSATTVARALVPTYVDV